MTVYACPECDGTNMHHVTGNDDPRINWACQNPECGERFRDPVKREEKDPSGSHIHGMAADLLAMDPDDVSRENLREVNE